MSRGAAGAGREGCGCRYSHVAEERRAGVHRGADAGPGLGGGGERPGGRGAVSAPRLLSPCRHVLAPKKGGHKRLQRGKARRPHRPPGGPCRGEPPAPLRGPAASSGGEAASQPRRRGRARPGAAAAAGEARPDPAPLPAVPAETEREAGQVWPGLGNAAKGRAPRSVAGGTPSPPRASVSPSVKRGLRARRVGRGRGSPRWGFAAPRARCGLGAGGRALPGRARH